MYKSPIELFEKQISDLAKQIQEQKENYVFQCIKEIGVNVDKEELIRALQYDRDQYNKGYADGVKALEEKLIKKAHSYFLANIVNVVNIEQIAESVKELTE